MLAILETILIIFGIVPLALFIWMVYFFIRSPRNFLQGFKRGWHRAIVNAKVSGNKESHEDGSVRAIYIAPEVEQALGWKHGDRYLTILTRNEDWGQYLIIRLAQKEEAESITH